MKIGTTPNPDKFCLSGIDPYREELALLLLAARDDFEYLAKQLEHSSGYEQVKELINNYRSRVKQADHFVDLIIKGGAL